MKIEPFGTFHDDLLTAAQVLANVANDPNSPHAAAAQAAIRNIKENTATEDEIAEAKAEFCGNEDVDICQNALKSESDEGMWISAFVFIPKS